MSTSRPYGEWDTALKNKYRRLKWKMMLQTMGIMMMSLVVGKMIVTLILDGLFQGKLLNLIIGILSVPLLVGISLYI